MHLRYRRDPAHGIGQRGLDVVHAAAGSLQMQQRRNDLQAVADAVVDLAQQHLALGGERGIAVARDPDFLFGGKLGAQDARAFQRTGDGDMQQGDEIAVSVFDKIVGGAGLQGGDGNAGVL